MRKTVLKVVGGGLIALLTYTSVVVPLWDHYLPAHEVIPATVSVNLQEEEAIAVIETEALVLESINSFKVEAKRLNIEVRDERNNWDSQTFKWWESKAAWKWLWGRGVDMQGVGYVTASFDLSRVTRADITRDGDIFVVNVGAPEISHVVLPEENVSHVTQPYQGQSVTADEIFRLEHYSRMQLKRNLHAMACSQDIFEQANQHIKTALPNFLRLTNGDSVLIRVETKTGKC